MEKATHDSIVEKTELLEKDIVGFDEIIKKLEHHYLTGESEYFWFGRTEEKFNALVELMGHSTFSGSLVLSFSYESLGPERTLAHSSLNPELQGEWTMHGLLNYLGDTGINLQFMNDFRVRATVRVDQESVILYEYRSSSEPVVCEVCAGDEQYSDGGMNAQYSCDHCEDEYSADYNAVLTKSDDHLSQEKFISFGY